MFTNYLILACRNLLKHKFFSFINIFGLAMGIAACLLILQFVSFEMSYDRFHTKAERIYRVINDRYQNGRLIQQGPLTYPAVSPAMSTDFAEVEGYSLTRGPGKIHIKAGDEIFRNDDFLFADEHFFSLFDFNIIAGQQSQPLKEPFTAVLTESTAKRYFGENDLSKVLGKEIYKGPEPQPYRVTAIIRDVPINSHLQFDLILSFASQMPPGGYREEQRWRISNVRHYVLLKPGADYRAMEARLETFSERYFHGVQVTGSIEKFSLQPLEDIHLYSGAFYNDLVVKASGKAIWGMLLVACFIVVIAWINYINLTTSRAMERAKEVGLRKVMGAVKQQLIRQFVFESVILIGVAVLVAVIIAVALQGPFNTLVGGNLSLGNMLASWDSTIIAIIVVMLAGGTLLAAFYPAFILSSYQPVAVLKGRFQRSASGQMLRKGLVVFQFTASCALITGTLIVSRQLSYMHEKDLGVKVDNIVLLGNPVRAPWDSTFTDRARMFKHAVRQLPQVIDAATGGQHPGTPLSSANNIRLQHQPDTEFTMAAMNVDEDYFALYEITLLEGRTFVATDFNFDWEVSNVVINKKACDLMGLEPKDAVGKKFIGDVTIVGVVADFHQKSLHYDIDPVVFSPRYDRFHFTAIKLSPGDHETTMAMIQKEYEKFFPDNGFEFQFVSERFNEPYKDDKRFSVVVSIGTGMAIFISGLGRMALSSYTALQRTQEVGIRKVLGASVMSIVSLLSYDFIKIVLIACVLSLPLAYAAAERWLSNYPYRIKPGFLVYALPVTLILVIAMITISIQIIKTAQRDPVRSLRQE
jgi:putative ABC transport system permease protein